MLAAIVKVCLVVFSRVIYVADVVGTGPDISSRRWDLNFATTAPSIHMLPRRNYVPHLPHHQLYRPLGAPTGLPIPSIQ
jgi:hypothetical protein